MDRLDVKYHTLTEYGREAAASAVVFGSVQADYRFLPLHHPDPFTSYRILILQYPIPFQEAGDALVTALGLRVFMSSEGHYCVTGLLGRNKIPDGGMSGLMENVEN
ncbi:hypothetical protein EVAR_48079_1 [Eumeta japonica]|uniref:Uncharacterized protein n=1 Tax=Eumeta variegata TaxID=151549 RepID=A0A4C1X7F4_EUMVA|nr:hypothetical protein EVAR_48079_1 [Eumeta japonica]